MPTISTTPLTAKESAAIDCNRDVTTSDMLASQISKLQEPGGPAARATILAQVQAKKAALDPTVQTFFASILAARKPPVSVPAGGTISRQTVSGVDSLVVDA
jgi:hypothetical protein